MIPRFADSSRNPATDGGGKALTTIVADRHFHENFQPLRDSLGQVRIRCRACVVFENVFSQVLGDWPVGLRCDALQQLRIRSICKRIILQFDAIPRVEIDVGKCERGLTIG